jgi:hypothetical protein
MWVPMGSKRSASSDGQKPKRAKKAMTWSEKVRILNCVIKFWYSIFRKLGLKMLLLQNMIKTFIRHLNIFLLIVNVRVSV